MERGAMPPVLRLTWCEIARAGVLDGGGGGVARGRTTAMVVVVVVEGEREVDDDERAAAPARIRQLPSPAFVPADMYNRLQRQRHV